MSDGAAAASVAGMRGRSCPRIAILLVLAAVLGALPGARQAAASTRIAGNVWIIDQDASMVTIIDAGHHLKFTYGDDTIIRRGSTNRTIHDLRRGDRIVVTLAEEMPDVPRARLIAIAGPPATAAGPLTGTGTKRKTDVFR